MLRATKLYQHGAIRSKVISNKLIGSTVLKRCESTVAEETKKSGSIFGKLVGVTVVSGATYGGAAYYASENKDFGDVFVTYVPGGQQSVEFIHDIRKNYDLDSYRSQANDWKKQAEDYASSAKDYGTKIQESTSSAVNYATETYQSLIGQKSESIEVLPPATSHATTTTPTTSSKLATATMTSDKESKPAVVAVTIEKPEPILVEPIASDNTTVRELSQIVYELAAILNETGLSGLGRKIIQQAHDQVEKLNKEFVAIDIEQDDILKSLKALAVQGGKVEGSLEKFRVEAHSAISNAHAESASAIVAREAQLKNQFEQTRAEMKTSFAQQLMTSLTEQKERLEQARADALAAQGEELQRQFVKQVKLLVEQERAGRLAKLDEIATRFKALEEYTIQNAKALDRSRQYHVIHVALNTLHDNLGSKKSQPFVEELKALNNSSKNDTLIQTVLGVIPMELAEQGVSSMTELATRFEDVSDEIRQVALVPEDGGFGSHIISLIMSHLMFKKAGLVKGDDVEAILARTEHYLKRNNLEYATRELNQLSGWPKRLAKSWIESARHHLEIKQALEIAETQAVLMSLLEA
ncbi:hypothetical protein K501DRAFT_234498 [Backusella circina FSU 941]|nr:hypothetical protein K501DRAFT_234498 [Backusella circina FSU 941]